MSHPREYDPPPTNTRRLLPTPVNREGSISQDSATDGGASSAEEEDSDIDERGLSALRAFIEMDSYTQRQPGSTSSDQTVRAGHNGSTSFDGAPGLSMAAFGRAPSLHEYPGSGMESSGGSGEGLGFLEALAGHPHGEPLGMVSRTASSSTTSGNAQAYPPAIAQRERFPESENPPYNLLPNPPFLNSHRLLPTNEQYDPPACPPIPLDRRYSSSSVSGQTRLMSHPFEQVRASHPSGAVVQFPSGAGYPSASGLGHPTSNAGPVGTAPATHSFDSSQAFGTRNAARSRHSGNGQRRAVTARPTQRHSSVPPTYPTYTSGASGLPSLPRMEDVRVNEEGRGHPFPALRVARDTTHVPPRPFTSFTPSTSGIEPSFERSLRMGIMASAQVGIRNFHGPLPQFSLAHRGPTGTPSENHSDAAPVDELDDVSRSESYHDIPPHNYPPDPYRVVPGMLSSANSLSSEWGSQDQSFDSVTTTRPTVHSGHINDMDPYQSTPGLIPSWQGQLSGVSSSDSVSQIFENPPAIERRLSSTSSGYDASYASALSRSATDTEDESSFWTSDTDARRGSEALQVLQIPEQPPLPGHIAARDPPPSIQPVPSSSASFHRAPQPPTAPVASSSTRKGKRPRVSSGSPRKGEDARTPRPGSSGNPRPRRRARRNSPGTSPTTGVPPAAGEPSAGVSAASVGEEPNNATTSQKRSERGDAGTLRQQEEETEEVLCCPACGSTVGGGKVKRNLTHHVQSEIRLEANGHADLDCPHYWFFMFCHLGWLMKGRFPNWRVTALDIARGVERYPYPQTRPSWVNIDLS